MKNEEVSQLFKLLDTFPSPVTLNKLVFDESGEPYDEIIYVNKSFVNTIGYEVEDIPTDRVWFTKAYPDTEYQSYISKEWFNAVEKARETQTDLTGFPAEVTCKNGEKHWFSITTQLNHPISDKYRTIVLVKTDAPAKTKLDLDKKSLELIRHELLLQTIIDTMPIRIFWKDKEGVYLGCNKAFLGDGNLNSLDDIVGKTDYDMVWKEDAERFRKDDKDVFDSGEAKLHYVERQPRINAKDLVLSTSKVLLKNLEGEAIGILGAYQDITDEHEDKLKIKEHEKLMIVQSRQAALGEMLSMIAHQWKQPLSAIASTVANIKVSMDFNSYTLEELVGHSQGIEDQVNYLAQTITDFSDFFRPDRGKERSDVCEPIKKALSIIDKQLESKGISLTIDCNDTHRIFTYTKELQQVCINILKNASDALIEHETKDAKIDIKVSSDETYAYYVISDNAGGIKEDIIEDIFLPYFSTKSEKNGTGLGLYVSKTIIVDHLKGTLTCENIDGGASFTIKVLLNLPDTQ